MLSLSENVKVLDLIKNKNDMLRLLRFTKDEFSIYKIVKKEKEISASFALVPHTAKIMGTVCDKCLVRM